MAKRQLVCEQLERIPRQVLDDYREIIREYIRGRNGIYALYRGDKLYYVGLATNLRSRLKQHLKDRHGEAWDRFSVYLTNGDSHLKEMESLLLRIAKPNGNHQSGRFCKCVDLKHRLRQDIRILRREEEYEIFGKTPAVTTSSKASKGEDRPVLSVYKVRPRRLRARYKGKVYRATVRSDGSIYYAGKRYNSPSLAAVAVVHRNMNGWWFWQYQNNSGEWVRLRELRQ